MDRLEGGCNCGQVRLTAVVPPKRVGVCHCMNCRKHHGAVFFAAAVFEDTAVTVTGPTHHQDQRHFCRKCGSSVFARSGDEIEIHLGILDRPNQLTPTYELWTVRRENWLAPIPGAEQFLYGRTPQDLDHM